MGRSDKKREEKQRKRNKLIKRTKKMMIFFMILFFFMGLSIVDNAYSNMTEKDGLLQIQFMRVDNEILEISILGQPFDLNTYLLSLKAQAVLENINQNIEKMAYYIKRTYYIQIKKEVKELPLDAQIL